MATFKLRFMASEHMVYDGDAESVSLMTTEGSIGILPYHSNLIMAVVPGIVEYVPAGEAADKAGMSGKQISVVSDGLLKVENKKAREDLKRANSNRDVALASAELSRAMSRIKASKHKHNL